MNLDKTTRGVLLFFAVVLTFYLLKMLSFIFIPLVSAVFLSLLFMPMMRWMNKKKVPKAIAVSIAVLIMGAVIVIITNLISLSTQQILQGKEAFWNRADEKLVAIAEPVFSFFGMAPHVEGGSVLKELLQSEQISKGIIQNFGNTLGVAQRAITTILMMLFFLILLLAGSLNVEKMMEKFLFGGKNSAVKAFREIEHSIAKFVKVKTLTSFCTGLGFGLTCYFFGINFSLFWGLLAFSLNYIQLIGSLIATIALVLFGMVELDHTGTIFFFALILTGIQVLFGGILEPILMGHSFRINTITILVVLMLFGFIWGIAGLILSIPILVMMKIIFNQFENTQQIVEIIS